MGLFSCHIIAPTSSRAPWAALAGFCDHKLCPGLVHNITVTIQVAVALCKAQE